MFSVVDFAVMVDVMPLFGRVDHRLLDLVQDHTAGELCSPTLLPL